MKNTNVWFGIGNLTRDVEVKYKGDMAWCRLSIACNRGNDKNGKDKGADFINIVAFGRQAELCGKYLSKGKKIAVNGAIQTGSYEREDGTKVNTTEVVMREVEFLSPREESGNRGGDSLPPGFAAMESDEPPF